MTAKQKYALELVESMGMTHAQAAAHLGINRVTFSKRVSQAREKRAMITRLVEAHLEGR